MQPSLFVCSVAATVALIASTVPAAHAQSVAAPGYKPGDSWTYREINGFNNLDRGTVVKEVEQAGSALRIQSRTADGRRLDSAVLADAGSIKDGVINPRTVGSFDPSLAMRPFPLNVGQRWSQVVQRNDPRFQSTTSVRVSGRVQGWETVRVPAGEFKALRIERDLNLGDHDAFRGESIRHEVEWYVPELRMPAKLTVREFYREGAGAVLGPFLQQDWYTQELVAHKPAS